MNEKKKDNEKDNVDIEIQEQSADEDTITPKKKKPSTTQLLKDELATLNDRLLRVMAEYDNYRKRTEKEKQSLVSLGTALALERILPVADTLEIAAEAETIDLDYKKGVELTLTMFISALNSLGITEIDALGKPFDPNIHNCVSTEETEDEEGGIVVKILQKGYCYGDRVIRPASVSVSS